MSYKFNWKGNNVIVNFEKEIGYNDIITVDGIAFGDSRFDRMTFAIYDFSNVAYFKITNDDSIIFSKLNMVATTWNKNLKLGLVAQNDDFINVCNEYKEYMNDSNWDIEIFRELKSAIEWVNMVKQSSDINN